MFFFVFLSGMVNVNATNVLWYIKSIITFCNTKKVSIFHFIINEVKTNPEFMNPDFFFTKKWVIFWNLFQFLPHVFTRDANFEKTVIKNKQVYSNWLKNSWNTVFFSMKICAEQLNWWISRSAHRTTNFMNSEFQFPQLKVLQRVFFFLFNIASYIEIFGCILILI